MKTNKKRVADFIIDNPNATNEEIASALDINENSIKSYISQLKTGGFIEVDGSGSKRTIKVIAEYKGRTINAATAEKIELKKDVYTKLLDRYMNDFDLTDDIDKHLKLGNSIMRILDNL